jgi:tetratricopeptide (TPR) repeat protein
VTELEILHGVLNAPEMAGRAYFYFRDPAFSEGRGADYASEDEDARGKLARLKERIRGSAFPVAGFATPEEVADRITDDLWRLIDAEYPEDAVPDELERERRSHEAYAAERRRLYIGQEETVAALLARLEAASDEPGEEGSRTRTTLVTAESGTGKSALIANTLARYREAHPDHVVIEHYIGSTSEASDPMKVIRRVSEEIKRLVGAAREVEADPEKLVEQFVEWLAEASWWAGRRGVRFVLALDALDKLSERSDLRWLPKVTAPHVRIVASSLDGAAVEAMRKRQPGEVQARPFTPEVARNYIIETLARRGRRLPTREVDRIVSHPRATLPIYLKTLVEELSVYGSHEGLPQRITECLAAQEPDDLFEVILARLEDDLGRDAVKKPLEAILLSPDGMLEAELADIAQAAPISSAWLRLALDEALHEAGGLIRFSHAYLSRAVFDRYLGGSDVSLRAHAKFARWWIARGSDRRSMAQADYHLWKSKDWEALVRLHVDPTTGIPLLRALDLHERVLSWTHAAEGMNAGDNVTEFVQSAFATRWADWKAALGDMVEEGASCLSDWSELFDRLSASGDVVLEVARSQLEMAKLVHEPADAEMRAQVGTAIHQLHLLHRRRNEVEEAGASAEELLQHSERAVAAEPSRLNRSSYAIALQVRAEMHELHEDADRAFELLSESERIRRELVEEEPTVESRRHHMESLRILSKLALTRSDSETAERLAADALALARALYEEDAAEERHRELTLALVALGDAALSSDNRDLAESCYVEAAKRRQAIVERARIPRNLRELSVSIDRVAMLYEQQEDFKEAERLFALGLEIAREVNAMTGDAESAHDIAVSLSCLGHVAEAQDEPARALANFAEATRVMEQLVNSGDTVPPVWFREHGTWLWKAVSLAIAVGDFSAGFELSHEYRDVVCAGTLQELDPAVLASRLSCACKLFRCQYELRHASAAETAEFIERSVEGLSEWLQAPARPWPALGLVAAVRQCCAEALGLIASFAESRGDAEAAGYAREHAERFSSAATLDRAALEARERLEMFEDMLQINLSMGIDEDPRTLDSFLRIALQLVELEERRGDLPAAASACSRALEMLEPVVAQQSELGAHPCQQQLLERGAAVAMRMRDFRSAIEHGSRAATVCRELLRASPDSAITLQLSRMLIVLSDAALGLSEPAAAVGYCEEAVSLRRQLVESTDTRAARMALAVASSRLAGAEHAAGRSTRARQRYDEVLAMLRAVGAADRGSPQERFDFTNVLEKTSEVARTLCDDVAARNYARQALAIRRELARSTDCPPDWRVACFRSQEIACECELAVGNVGEAWELAMACWQQAVATTDGNESFGAIEYRLGVFLHVLRCEIRMRERSRLAQVLQVATSHIEALLAAFADPLVDRVEHRLDSSTLSVCAKGMELVAGLRGLEGNRDAQFAALERANALRASAEQLKAEEDAATDEESSQ